MSQAPTHIPDPDVLDEPVEPSGSLSSRMQARAQELQSQRTTIIEIPGYEGILAAEYRMLSWETVRKIAQRHRKQPEALRELYAACDTLITACEQMYEVLPDGTRTPIDERWTQLARRAGKTLPEDASPRVALITLFDVDTRIIAHYQEWMNWQQGESSDVDMEIAADFATTR